MESEEEYPKATDLEIPWKGLDITPDKIPIEYRNDAKILSFVSAYASHRYTRKDSSRLKVKLFKALPELNLESATDIYRNYSKNYDTADFS